MSRIEKRVLGFFNKHLLFIALGISVVLSLFIRYQLRGFLTGDMTKFLLPWAESMNQHGLRETLKLPDCNYHVAYLLLLQLASYLPVEGVVQIKIISVVFDYLAAAATALIMLHILPENKNKIAKSIAVAVVMLLMPTVFANSAVWGQCDVIYTFFCLASFLFLLKEKYTLAFTMFGFALCFKLQALFFVPFLIVLYLTKKKFSILQFLQPVSMVFLFGLLGRSKGDSIFYGFTLYTKQAGTYPELYKDYPNFWYLVPNEYEIFAPVGIAATIAIFVFFMAFVVYKNWQPSNEALLLLAAWTIFTCAQFLPSMHERYAFPAEWFLWLYFLARPTAKRFAMTASIYSVALLMYFRVFFERNYITQEQMAMASILGYVLVTVALVRQISKDKGGFSPTSHPFQPKTNFQN